MQAKGFHRGRCCVGRPQDRGNGRFAHKLAVGGRPAIFYLSDHCGNVPAR
jgi:hypothetical protein